MTRRPSSVVQMPPAALPEMLPNVLDALLALAGPVVAKDLLIQLLADLDTARQALHTAADPPDWPPDWPMVQVQSHNLIALAGTVGAPRLHRLAQLINIQTHQSPPNLDAFHSLLPQMLDALKALIYFIRQKLHNCEDTA